MQLKDGHKQSLLTCGLMPSEWQMSPPMNCQVCPLRMAGLPYKPSQAPEPQQIQDFGNHLPVLSMFWTQLSRQQGASLENGKRDQGLASTLAVLQPMLDPWPWS